jgi:large repetitive protein
MALQTKDPSQAVITSVGGAVDGGKASSTTPVITGTADAGNVISIYDGVRLLGTATVAAHGAWSFTPTVALKGGSHSFAAIAQDSQGNHGASSAPVNVQVGTAVPATPAAPTFTDDSGHSIPAGSTTSDNHPHINGTGTAGDTITVYDGSTVLGTTTVAANGTWTFTPSTNLSGGSHSISVTDTNAAGTSSAHSASTAVTIAAAPPVITSIVDSVGPVQGNIPMSGYSDDKQPVFNGTRSKHPRDWQLRSRRPA